MSFPLFSPLIAEYNLINQPQARLTTPPMSTPALLFQVLQLLSSSLYFYTISDTEGSLFSYKHILPPMSLGLSSC